jgi:tetratricopeptide (TPR) repeat protein
MQSRPKVPERLRLKARALTYMSPELDSLSAISAWRELRALDPRDVEATLALIELYAASGRRDYFDELAEYAERWCGVDEGMRRALTQAALSYEARFEDDEEAFRCWSVLLERAPQLSERALVALERLAKRAGLWSSLDERWVKYAERSSRPTERARALLAQTALCAGPLHHWQIALELLPALEERRPQCQTVRALYSEVVPPLRKWPILVERQLRWAEEMPEGPAKAERLSRVAELLETRLEDPQGALQCYELASSMSSGARSEELTRDVTRLKARLSASAHDDSAEP